MSASIPQPVKFVPANSQPPLKATPFEWRNPATLPPRQWVYGRHLIRRFTSVTVAPGGVGKSSLTICEALAMVSGRNLLGDTIPAPLRVWILNLEDPRDELERRITATMLHHSIQPEDVAGKLFVDSGRERGLCTATQGREGVQINVPEVEALVAEIKARGIDVLIVDPFVSSHRVSENDNGAIDVVAKNAPTTEALRAQARQAYQAVDDAGIQIKPEAFDKTRQKITQMLRDNTGFDELPGPGSLTPHAARASQVMQEVSQQMAQEPTAALPFKALDQMRRQAGAAAGNFTNKADQRAGMEIIKGLDDFVQRLGPDDIAAGDAKVLQDALPKARELWSRMSRSETIDNAIEAGENYLSGGSSGIRNQFARILRSPKLSKGFTEAEKAAMRRVVNGSTSERLLNLLGGGLGQLGQIGVGAGVGGVPGAALGAMTGAVARKGSEAVSRKNAELVRALIANGGLETLPTASDGPRKLVESMLRRGAAEAGR